jgi:hypothetical protein
MELFSCKSLDVKYVKSFAPFIYASRNNGGEAYEKQEREYINPCAQLENFFRNSE